MAVKSEAVGHADFFLTLWWLCWYNYYHDYLLRTCYIPTFMRKMRPRKIKCHVQGHTSKWQNQHLDLWLFYWRAICLTMKLKLWSDIFLLAAVSFLSVNIYRTLSKCQVESDTLWYISLLNLHNLLPRYIFTYKKTDTKGFLCWLVST